jgi:hypothetical protein
MLVLSDRLFVNQTRQDFIAPHDAKLKVFETFAAMVESECLEILCRFLIAQWVD